MPCIGCLICVPANLNLWNNIHCCIFSLNTIIIFIGICSGTNRCNLIPFRLFCLDIITCIYMIFCYILYTFPVDLYRISSGTLHTDLCLWDHSLHICPFTKILLAIDLDISSDTNLEAFIFNGRNVDTELCFCRIIQIQSSSFQ